MSLVSETIGTIVDGANGVVGSSMAAPTPRYRTSVPPRSTSTAPLNPARSEAVSAESSRRPRSPRTTACCPDRGAGAAAAAKASVRAAGRTCSRQVNHDMGTPVRAYVEDALPSGQVADAGTAVRPGRLPGGAEPPLWRPSQTHEVRAVGVHRVHAARPADVRRDGA